MTVVLMLSRFFPPMFDVGGKRAARFAKYLPEHGVRPVVLTARPGRGQRTDPTPFPLPAEVRVVREYYPRWATPTHRGGSAGATRGVRRARPTAPRWLRLPVAGDLWHAPRVLHVATQLVREHAPDVIWATSSPYSCLVFGAQLSARTGVPLCLDLRDPWTPNFLQRERPRWVRAVDARVERAVLERAARTSFTAQATQRAYQALYPDLAQRFTTIYNSFDPGFAPSADEGPPPQGPFDLVHFGNCYGERSLADVLHALATLRADGLDATRLTLTNLGGVSDEDRQLAARLGVASQLRVAPPVPYAEGVRRLARADLGLLLGYGQHGLFVPAKLYDYLLARTPVLCVAPRSELWDIVERTRAGQCVEPGDRDALRDSLRAATQAPRGAARLHDTQALAPFDARHTAGQLADLLRSVVRTRRGAP